MSVNTVKGSGGVATPNAVAAPEAAKAEKTAPKNAAHTAYAKAKEAPSVKDAANVQISPRAKELSMAKKIAEETPDVREDKVAKFKEQINKGEYNPDSGKIADGILREAIRDEIAKDPSIIFG
ncbi:flagellar biosynthesis anti-sigma factor FlgM [Fluviispira multicolorata]|uniref:Negative regulator of flagellin synthesis n=1 Tax=Fluviispira multicolorata TaxID=2654512 RepID=A0A833N5W8_9BACT|nr:flagellar biosynthesis anti-sigma factor FlgM [Fluviispira multicolorata]KAB8031809.1 flagellar biosynthesis anti-sigma factor FlgM [Fluviispira multicolorata]